MEKHPHKHTLPIIGRFIAVYKLWDGYRNNFPQKYRYTLGNKIDSLFLDALELLFIAQYLDRDKKLPILQKAGGKLDTLKFFVSIAWELRVLDEKKYIASSEQLHEIGRMLGGWIKGIQSGSHKK